MRKSKSGFTLIELVVVVVIIGILAGIVIATYRGTQSRTRDTRRKTDITNITKALEIYYGDNGTYPVTSSTGSSLGPTWYSSGDASWSTFNATMTTANAIDSLPVDPTPSLSIAPWNSNGYQYAYIANGACSSQAQGQWYLLVWRYEITTKEKTTTGSCAYANATTYYNAGASYYLFSRS